MLKFKYEFSLPGDKIWREEINNILDQFETPELKEIALAQFICSDILITQLFLKYLRKRISEDNDCLIINNPTKEDCNPNFREHLLWQF